MARGILKDLMNEPKNIIKMGDLIKGDTFRFLTKGKKRRAYPTLWHLRGRRLTDKGNVFDYSNVTNHKTCYMEIHPLDKEVDLVSRLGE